jgi:hypothetical protein
MNLCGHIAGMLLPSVGKFWWKEYGGTMKKQMVRILFSIFVIGFLLATPANQVFASLANASASLDWSQLSIFGSLNWVSKSTNTNATVSNGFGETGVVSDPKPGWVSSSSAVTISNAGAQGISGVLQSLSAASYSSLADKGWSNSSGSTILTGSFTATTTGWVIITIPYYVSLDLAASSDLAASAQGRSKATISLFKTGGSLSIDSMEIFTTVYDGNTYNQNQSGILGLMKLFNAGETGTFTAEVFTETATSNAVPLPGALLLFVPGLACFFGLRRKFRN